MSKDIAETKIKGLKIYMSMNCIIITDSYKILNKNKMSIILDEIKQKENYFFTIDKRTKKHGITTSKTCLSFFNRAIGICFRNNNIRKIAFKINCVTNALPDAAN